MKNNTTLFVLFLFLLGFMTSVDAASPKKNSEARVKALRKSVPDSAFQKVQPENLLEDFTYVKLAKEGWTTKEIFAITDDFVTKNRKQMRGSLSYAGYTKEWKPYWYMMVPNDTIKRFMNEQFNVNMQKKVNKAFKENAGNYLPRIFYTPTDRMNGVRNKGYFRHNAIFPASGRIHWIQPHPTDPDKLMLIPDGDGIWRTDNGGRNWVPVTDRIPDRFHRSQAKGYCIPVDPDDWNHFFAFMENTSAVYETTDGGESWTVVPNASNKSFKRGYAFKDAAGTLKFVGVERNTYTGWAGALYISDNKGVTWRPLTLSADQMDTNTDGSKKVWLQEFAFDPVDRNLIYITTSRGILRSTDGLAYKNGKFNVERMSFKVYNRNKTVLRSEGTSFPLTTSDGPMMIEIDPKDANKMWVALGQKAASPHQSAVFYSEDKGATWVTLTDTSAGIGSGQVFGNEAPGGWLGGFAVNFVEPNYMYGCTMSSAKSSNGGNSFDEFSWGIQMKGFHPDGKLYNVSSARHNADNHMMVSTPSGRIFRASDAGVFTIDKNINGREWTNISGDMGQTLIYRARINDFGDQTIIVNTQDIDAQTYRYGRWGAWRGYEGSTVAINPMSNETYYSGGGGGAIEGTSWGDSWIAGFGRPDVVTGNWYLWRDKQIIGTGSNARDIGVIKDIGRSVQPLTSNTASPSMLNKDFALCRDTTVGSSLLVLRNDGNIVRFDNESESYITIPRPAMGGYSGSCIAVNPDNVYEIYIGDTSNGILKTTNGGSTWTSISKGSGGIPAGVSFNNIYYHEGSGDIYAVSSISGIYLLENGATAWRLWMKGYNPASFGGAEISYASQEMMIYDYGRGVWIADLENPSDRFFKNGFKIKQTANTNGVRTFGIDTKWDIPLFHNYEWSVNGQVQANNPYRYFSAANLKAGDKVKLKLTLREAPDVITTSAEYTVPADQPLLPEFAAGRSIRSAGTGRMDLGHLNFFNADFTVEMWVKPGATTGALIGNRKLDTRDQQGWLLSLNNGAVRFVYSPYSVFSQPSYETPAAQETVIVTTGTPMPVNEWAHIAVSVESNRYINIYVNGVLKRTVVRQFKGASLNSVQPLSLLADGYEQNEANAAVDELRIWKKALSIEEIRAKMSAKPSFGETDLVYYNDFNAETTAAQKETFTQHGMRSRIRAEVSYPKMSMAVCATYAKYDTISATAKELVSQNQKLVNVRSTVARANPVTVNRFDNVYHASGIYGMTDEHFEFAPYVYKIDVFNSILSADSMEVKFFVPNAATFNGESIYIGDADSEKAQWTEYSQPVSYNAAEGVITAKFKMQDINGKLIAFVKAKPAIALNVTAASPTGLLPVYKETDTDFAFTASLLKGMPAPDAPYALTSSRPLVQTQPLVFQSNSATGTLKVNTDSLGTFNNTTPVVITGADNRMIPYRFELQNKIASKWQGTALAFNGGGATVGSPADYAPLNNSNTISMMAWVRIDDAAFLTASEVRPLIFFRGGGKTAGLHFQNGELRCHWNEESWSWSLATGLKLTTADVSRWVHIALVTTPTSISYYLNGKRFTSNRAMSPTGVLSPLMLGQNNAGDTWFKGAIDQVALWNRSLSEAEVLRYMHERVYLNDAGLVSYLNMDVRGASGTTLVDMKTGSSVNTVGSVTENFRSTFPFTLSSQVSQSGATPSSATDAASVTMPASVKGTYYLTQYARLPYNYYINGVEPVYNGFFSVAYNSAQTFGASDVITFTCRLPQLKVGDKVYLATRQMGVETAFAQKATATATQNGVAVCTVPARDLAGAFEAMWFIDTANLPVVEASVVGAVGNKFILKDDAVGIPVQFRRTSAQTGGKIDLVVSETAFARFDEPQVDLSTNATQTRTLLIDRNKVNQVGYNDLHVSFIGAAGSELIFQFALEPVVELKLVNGSSADQITAKTATQLLDISATVVRGVLEQPVTLDVQSDLQHGVSVGTNYLTVTGGDKTFDGFNFVSSANAMSMGWNTSANPYLTNFLVSKTENIERGGVSSFFYRYNPETKNFIAYDVRYFDSDMTLRPLEPILIQTNSGDAKLVMKTGGKSREFNRQNTASFILSEEREVVLEVWKDDVMYDRTAVRFNDAATENFEFDMDAAKVFSIDMKPAQIYTVSNSEKYSINALPKTVSELPLGFRTYTSGSYTFKVVKTIQEPNWQVNLTDATTNVTTPVAQAGNSYTFDAGLGVTETRFKLLIQVPAGFDNLHNSKLRVWSQNNTCYIDGLTPGAEITVFDVQGKKVVNTVSHSSTWNAKFNTGVYIVKVVDEGKNYNGKIIVK